MKIQANHSFKQILIIIIFWKIKSQIINNNLIITCTVFQEPF